MRRHPTACRDPVMRTGRRGACLLPAGVTTAAGSGGGDGGDGGDGNDRGALPMVAAATMTMTMAGALPLYCAMGTVACARWACLCCEAACHSAAVAAASMRPAARLQVHGHKERSLVDSIDSPY